MAAHSSTLAWRIPWTEELQSAGCCSPSLRKESDMTERPQEGRTYTSQYFSGSLKQELILPQIF